jgi:serine/threonine protein kinase/Leucine-rich repeat (LRR) protein
LKQCPGGAELERFFLGRLAELDYAGIEEHVPHCPFCLHSLESLDARDPLLDALRCNLPGAVDADHAAVERLVQRLRKPVGDAVSAVAPRPGPAHDRLTLPCPNCGRTLRLKAELAGKKGKCPSCRHGFRIPEHVGARVDPDTVVPLGAAGENTPPVTAENVSATIDAPVPPELYDFLAPARQPDEIGRLGNYRVLKVLGAGGMGVVFQAEDIGLDRKVALKTMLPVLAASASGRERFLREARTAAKVEHDHIVPIFQVGEDRGVPFIAMPFLKGEPLNERLQREGPLPVAEVVRIGRETARGLAAAHAAGLIHRDVKPANLWLEGEQGRVKILDFGLARGTGDGERMTLAGAIVGTPAYMAPEQAGGGQPLDGRCDLFSLGCVLYRALTGDPPFTGDGMISTLMAVATEQPAAPRELDPAVPAPLSDLIMRLLAKKAADRPADATAVADELAAIGQTLAAPPLPLPRKARNGRRRWTVAAGLAAFVLLAAGLVIRLRHKDGTVTEIPVSEGTKIAIEQVADSPKAPADSAVEFDKWVAQTAKLPFGQIVPAVVAKLRERNPGFSEAVRFDPAKPGPVDVAFCTDNVSDISPLRALSSLSRVQLSLCGSAPGKGKLADLSPLRGLQVVSLEARCNPVTDVMPLQKLPLEKLALTDSRVSDLTPLATIPTLRTFAFSSEVAADLTPVWEMPLRSLWLRELEGATDEDLKARVRSLYTLEQINDRGALDFWDEHDPKHAAFLRWLADTRKLPASKRVREVEAKFKERNPEFDDRLQVVSRGGEVTEVSFFSDHVTDMSPLRAFPRMKVLRCSGHYVYKGGLADLSPLRGLALEQLDCKENPKLKDLTPLKHMTTLTLLSCSHTGVEHLIPLSGLRLHYFDCYYTRVKDIGPLEGMPMINLNFSGCGVRDLELLRHMPLHRLDMKQTPIKDLTPLEGLPLEHLDCTLMRAPDLTPLRKTPIKKLFCEHPEQLIESISRLWTLEEVNGDGMYAFYQKYSPARAALMEWVAKTRLLPAEQQVEAFKVRLKQQNPDLDVSRVEAGVVDRQVTSLTLPSAGMTDLSPVRALTELRFLRCAGSADAHGKVSDLTPLAYLTLLERLDISRTSVVDLVPLRGLKLASLNCEGSGVRDLSPLKKTPMQDLRLDPETARGNRGLLLALKTLHTINDRPVAEFWKDLDEKGP